MLCLQKWGFAVTSPDTQGHWWAKGVIIHITMVRTNSHAQTHTCTRSEVPVLHFLIHCYSPSPPAWSFYDSLSSSWAVWLQEGTSLLNSPCIFRRPVIKEGARAVKQRVGKRDINTSSLLSDSWTPDMSEKTNRKRRCKLGPVVKKRVIRGAQNLLLRVSHIHKKKRNQHIRVV